MNFFKEIRLDISETLQWNIIKLSCNHIKNEIKNN